MLSKEEAANSRTMGENINWSPFRGQYVLAWGENVSNAKETLFKSNSYLGEVVGLARTQTTHRLNTDSELEMSPDWEPM